jgi:hypothetical protein
MRITEIYKKTDYVRCPDGQRHKYEWAGGYGAEAKTNREVENWKCGKCGVTKTVFCDTKQRVNR